MTISSGTTANKNGINLENTVEDLLIRNEYQFVEKKRFKLFCKTSGQPIYSKQVNVGRTIYDKSRRCDFIIFHPSKFKDCLIIECKWQQSKGSVKKNILF